MSQPSAWGSLCTSTGTEPLMEADIIVGLFDVMEKVITMVGFQVTCMKILMTLWMANPGADPAPAPPLDSAPAPAPPPGPAPAPARPLLVQPPPYPYNNNCPCPAPTHTSTAATGSVGTCPCRYSCSWPVSHAHLCPGPFPSDALRYCPPPPPPGDWTLKLQKTPPDLPVLVSDSDGAPDRRPSALVPQVPRGLSRGRMWPPPPHLPDLSCCPHSIAVLLSITGHCPQRRRT